MRRSVRGILCGDFDGGLFSPIQARDTRLPGQGCCMGRAWQSEKLLQKNLSIRLVDGRLPP